MPFLELARFIRNLEEARDGGGGVKLATAFCVSVGLLALVVWVNIARVERGQTVYEGGNEAVADAAPYGLIGRMGR